MTSLNLIFQAYISSSLGRPLLSYFKNHPHFNPKDMVNYDWFKQKLQAKDRGLSTWIPEPLVGSVRDTYFATDDVDFHEDHCKHGKRLRIEANIDLTKIGKFGPFDTIFSHQSHNDGSKNKLYHQHSDISTQVQAYIQKVPSYVDTGTTFIETDAVYKGIFNKRTKRSGEDPLKTAIANKPTGTFIHERGAMPMLANNTTVIKVAASADYPHIFKSTHIDFELEIELAKDLFNKRINVHVSGWHNDFPAYELIIDGLVKYSYSPARHGHTGPTLYNLGLASTNFYASASKNLCDWEINELGQNKTSFGW